MIVSCLRPELLRRHSRLLLEQSREILRVFEAEGVGYLADGGGGETVAGLLDEVLRTVSVTFYSIAA